MLLTIAPHGPMPLPFPAHGRRSSRTDPVFADLHGSGQVRGPAETVRGRRDLGDVAGL